MEEGPHYYLYCLDRFLKNPSLDMSMFETMDDIPKWVMFDSCDIMNKEGFHEMEGILAEEKKDIHARVNRYFEKNYGVTAPCENYKLLHKCIDYSGKLEVMQEGIKLNGYAIKEGRIKDRGDYVITKLYKDRLYGATIKLHGDIYCKLAYLESIDHRLINRALAFSLMEELGKDCSEIIMGECLTSRLIRDLECISCA